MGAANTIAWGLPFCQDAHTAKADQSSLSIGLRIAAVALGSIAVLTGILVLCNIPGLSQLGTTGGWTILIIGACFIMLGAALKCIKKNPHNQSVNTKNNSERAPKLYQRNELKDSNLSSGLGQLLNDLNQPNTNTDASLKMINIPKNLVETNPQSSEHPIELAKKEIFKWDQGKTVIGFQFEAAIAKIKQIANELPKEKITLHFYYFARGFNFYYAEKQGNEKNIPVAFTDGFIMEHQIENKQDSCWPILDPQKNAYFNAKVILHDVRSFAKLGIEAGAYIRSLLTAARLDQKNHSSRILEALTPYAKEIKQECGDDIYNQIRSLFPAYPEVPA